MRRSWIAVGIIALAIGLAAGYRLARVERPPQPPPSASPVAAGAPGTSPAKPGDASASPAIETQPDDAPATASRKRPTPEEHFAEVRRSSEALSSVPFAPAPAAPPERSEKPRTNTVVASANPPPPRPAPVRPVSPNVSAAGQQPPAAAPAPESADKGAKSETIDPDSDRISPALESLRFDPPEVQDGTDAILTVGATDNLSGVKSIVGTIRSPSDAAMATFVAQDQGGSGAFVAKISIPRQAETGTWYVGSLQIVDRANNPLNINYNKTTVPPGGSLRVVSADSDSTAPTVHRVSVEKPTVSGGERNQVVIEVEDDRSGVASVNGAFQSPSRAAFIPFGAVAGAEGTWTGIVAIPAAADCGEWTLRQIRVADKANNSAILMADSPQLGHVSFMVAGGGACDPDPPVLDGIFLSPTVVSNSSATDVVITVTAHDDGSGMASMNGRVEGPVASGGQVPRIFFGTKADASNPNAPMTARITFPVSSAGGIWRVAFLELKDKANNSHGYNAGDPTLANAYLTVE